MYICAGAVTSRLSPRLLVLMARGGAEGRAAVPGSAKVEVEGAGTCSEKPVNCGGV